MGEAVERDKFYSDSRGPELDRVYWSSDGRDIKAVDYRNPDDCVLRHVKFVKAQVVMITPEEVIDASKLDPAWEKGVGIVNLGKSAWLNSFAPAHLARCDHYQLLFYDESLDIICEGLEFGEGPYGLISNG